MCYAIPGKLVEIKGNIGVVDYFGEKRNVLIDLDVTVGDYVYAQGGVLITKVTKDEAEKTLDFWKEQFFDLKKVDAKLSRTTATTKSENLLAILQKVNTKKELNSQDMQRIMGLTDTNELKLLYETANNVRHKENDNACCVHGIIEFSNYCKNRCDYCGINQDCDVKRYRMTVDEIMTVAKDCVTRLGFKALVLQSGEDAWYDDEKLVRIVSEIRKLGVLVFVSIGMRSKETYKKLYHAGARAALLRFETSNRKLFEKLRPGTSFDERIALIRYLKELGYVLATGFLVGLPGETESDIIENILLTRTLKADMYSFGPLIPAPQTKLEKAGKTDKNLLLKTIALTRFIDREAKILVTTALETLDKDAKKEGLLAGANSLMINITPLEYRNLYSIYPGRAGTDKGIEQQIKETTDLLYSLGRAPTDIGL